MPTQAPTSAVNYEAEIEAMLTEIRGMNESMIANRKVFEQLKAESHLLKVATRRVLSGLGVRP